MPKRSKKEKIISNLRRRVTALEEKPSVYKTQKKIEEKIVLSKENFDSQNDLQKTILIKKDLLKTFVLSILAITVELVLYFVGKRG